MDRRGWLVLEMDCCGKDTWIIVEEDEGMK